jgi:hypothetical protein
MRSTKIDLERAKAKSTKRTKKINILCNTNKPLLATGQVLCINSTVAKIFNGLVFDHVSLVQLLVLATQQTRAVLLCNYLFLLLSRLER